MGNSWGHTIRPLSDAEVERARDSWGRACRTPRCDETALFEATHQYVAGRGGRVSHARKRLCGAHAEKFRAKYEPVELPAEAPSQHLSEAAFAQVRGSA